jgi:hypothetical protein
MDRTEALLKMIIKDFGLGALWITLGLSSSKQAVTIALVIMGTGQFALSAIGALKRARAARALLAQIERDRVRREEEARRQAAARRRRRRPAQAHRCHAYGPTPAQRRRALRSIPAQRRAAVSDPPLPHVGGGITSSTVPALPQHEHAVAS